MWARRRAADAPRPPAAEGRRARGIHQAAADEAPLSNAGALFFFPAQQLSQKLPIKTKYRNNSMSMVLPSAGLPSPGE
jgi:hypothetical protein